MMEKLGYMQKYRTMKNKLITNHPDFEHIPEEQRDTLNTCFMSLILWWQKKKVAPEEISIKEYLELEKEFQKILLDCLKTPYVFRVHYKLSNLNNLKF